jgi:SIR2-like domain
LNSDIEAHCRIVRRRLLEGKVIPFLGAGASVCGRPVGVDPIHGPGMPSGFELAAYLATEYAYPQGEPIDLTRVAQYVHAVTGTPVLYEELRRIFDRDAEPTALHGLLATVPRLMRERGAPVGGMLIVTTNYDDLVERAFRIASEPLDVVVYVAKGELQGKFVHHIPDGGEQVIEQPNRYRELQPRERTVLLKLHGAINRQRADGDSFVITEDHYIDYLAQTDIANLVPATLMALMNEAHFLFLGYGLADWNLRVILHRIWGQQPFDDRIVSWAAQKSPSKLEGLLWDRRNVEILDVDLLDYAETLGSLLAQPHDETRTR